MRSVYKKVFLGLLKSYVRVLAYAPCLLLPILADVTRENKTTIEVSASHEIPLQNIFISKTLTAWYIYGFVLLFPSLGYFYLEFTRKLYRTLMWIPEERYTSCLMF